MNADEMLLIGRIVAPFGVRGETKVTLVSNRPEYLQKLKRIYLGDEFEQHVVKRFHEHKQGLFILRLDAVSTRDDAELLRGTDVYIHQSQTGPLEADEYFLHDLVGLAVQTQTGEALGKVVEVLETGANEVLVVKQIGKRDLLVPMIREVVVEINLAEQQIVISSLDAILPE